MQETVVILNPAARSARAARWHARIRDLAAGAVVCATSRTGEAESFARAAVRDGYRKIVAAGGDGTINEVVNGMASSDAALGLLPMGTVNVFARQLGLPWSNLAQCWDIIRSGHTRSVDLPNANGKHFVQLAGVGLDAQAVKETSLALKRSLGAMSYVLAAAQIAFRPAPRLIIECPDAAITEGCFVLIGNGRLYGGAFPFFKRAAIDDGRFDVLIFKRIGLLEILRCLQDVIFCPSIKMPKVEYFQTTHLRVSCQEDVPVELDGELTGACPVKFEVQPRALRVLAPP